MQDGPVDLAADLDPQLADILSLSQVAIAVADPATHALIHVNDAFVRLVGLPRESILGRTSSELGIHPDPEEYRRKVEELAIKDGMDARELRIRRASGEERIVVQSIGRLKHRGRTISLAFLHDVTEERRIQRLAHEREAFLGALLRVTRSPVLVTRLATGEVTYVSDELCALTGWDRSEMLGRTIGELGLVSDPAAQARILEIVSAHGVAPPRELPIRTKGGETRTVLFNVGAATLEGEPCLVGVLHDITALRAADRARERSDARFRAMFEGASVGIALVDPVSGRFLAVNPSLSRLLGYTSDELLNLGWRDITRPEDSDLSESGNSRVLARSGGSVVLHKSYRRKDGTLVRVRTTLHRSADGDPPGPILSFVEDVSAQVEADAARREAEDKSRKVDAQLATLFHVSKAPILVATLSEGRIVEANDAAVEQLGWAREELLGRTTTELGFFGPSAPMERAAILAALEAGGTGGPAELHFEDRHGRQREFLVTVGAVTVGSEPCVLGVLQDVTALREANRVRHEVEDRFRTMFEQGAVGMAISDPDTGRFLDVNQALASMLGYRREELAMLRWPDIVDEGDRAMALEAVERLANGSLRAETHERRYRRKDGSTVWVRSNISAVRSASGAVSAYLGIIEDVSARHDAEALGDLLTSALEAADDGVVITDGRSNIEWVNPAVTRITGFAPGDLLGRSSRMLVAGDALPMANEIRAAMRDRRAWRGDITALRKDGSTYTEHLAVTPILGSDGTMRHTVGIKHDMTATRRAQEELRAAQKMEAIGRLAGGVAHDFNNLLSVILSYGELMLESIRAEDPLRGDLLEIQEAGRRAAALTQQLLAFSRRQTLAVERVDVRALVDGLGRMLPRLIGEDVRLTIDEGQGDFPVLADKGQIEQVVMNLVVNARDAMPGGGYLRISTSNDELDEARAAALEVSPGAYVVLEVADTGTGMDEATRARIFEPFFTTKGLGKGTGLGLSTVFGIVKQSRGAVEVESAPGAGARFRVLLPRYDQPTESAEEPVPSQRPSIRAHETVLVVEDEAALRNVVTRTLQREGYRMLSASGPEEALRMLATEGRSVDLLLTDVIMPEGNGREVARQWQARFPDVRVLFMSGYTDVLEHGDIPSMQLLRKPFDKKRLLDKVRSALEQATR